MRQVIKAPEPLSFSTWKAQKSDEWAPQYSNLPKAVKERLLESLLLEQGYTYCYCGKEIAITESHIEHFRPQKPYVEDALEYTNLFASCMRSPPPGTELSCGHSKGREFDSRSFISPLDPCEAEFRYAIDGQIIPLTSSAEIMTKALNLNAKYLILRRAAVLEQVFTAAFLEDVTAVQLEQLAASYRTRDVNGSYLSFFHVLARFASDTLSGPAG